MRTPRSLDSLEPYFQPGTGGSGDGDGSGGTWHEISQLPLTEPKVSSVEASVYELKYWEEAWLDWHRGHTIDNAEYVTYGELSDEDRPYPSEMKEEGGWESDSDTEFLVRCCGEDRPLRKAAKLVVKPSAGNHFVTVHDYVSAVHPWLMNLREDIMKAKTLELGFPATLPAEFMVRDGPELMRIEDKEHRIQQLGGGPRSYNTPAAILDRLRRNR